MHSWKTALITLVIFGLGGLAGTLITARVIKSKIERVEVTRPVPGMFEGEWIPQTIRVMEKQLHLSPEQTGRIRGIMLRAQQETFRLRVEWQQNAAGHEDPNSPELLRARNEWRITSRKVIARSDEEVAALLAKEQLPLFEEFKRKRGSLMQNRPNGGPPRQGKPPGDRPLIERPPLPPRTSSPALPPP